MTKKSQQFEKERKKTDDSLDQERGKIDQSLHHGRGDVHVNTDEIVSNDRIQTDRERLQQRNTADLKNTIEVSDNALEKQRKSEDKAIANERSNMDTALKNERGEKEKLLNKIVSQEREATDKNLKGERIKADVEVGLSAERLTTESAAHVETKTALTTHEEFVAIVSHDLKNPIGAILSSADILLDNNSMPELSSQARNLIELIQRNAQTSLRLINDILDMERIAEGKLQLQLTKNRIDDLIKDSVETFSHVAAKKKILLKTLPTNSSIEVLYDRDRVGQVISNLIGNAIKFTPLGGSVTVEAQMTDSEVTVTVRDTGPGIPADQKSRIFERFAQIANKQRGGIGLGLYISKMLVESHLGKIWVTSEPGSGSVFSFTLPIKG
jgi:signal transduction histidine kinase